MDQLTTNQWPTSKIIKHILLPKPKDAPAAGSKEILFRVLLAAMIAGIVIVFNQYNTDSPQAKKVKEALTPIAQQFEIAQKTGDRNATLSLLEPVTKIINDFNNLPEAQKQKINDTKLRYCILAAINLSAGISEFYESGYWSKKDQYQNSFDECE